MPNILRRLRIDEVSSVDRGAGEGVRIMLMKRDDDDAEYWKREFSAEQRRAAASSGAALPDGSFPIKNKQDLHNAMRAIGRAKDPGKAKAHIRARARALGLSGELSEAFKAGSYGERLREYFTGLFSSPEPDKLDDAIDQAVDGLAKSVNSIVADGGDNEMLAETFAQFREHLDDEVAKAITHDRAPSRTVSPAKENAMTPQLLKALGLKEDASEEDALKAIAALDKARNGKKEREEEDEEEEEEEEEHEKEKAFTALPEAIRKQLAEGQEALAEVKKLRDAAELEAMRKRAIDTGLPDAEAETLLKAFRGDKASVEKLLGFTKQGFAAAREAGTFKEIGSARNDGAGATAVDQIKAKAAELRKAMPHLTEEQAFTKVYETDRDLARRERSDNAPRFS